MLAADFADFAEKPEDYKAPPTYAAWRQRHDKQIFACRANSTRLQVRISRINLEIHWQSAASALFRGSKGRRASGSDAHVAVGGCDQSLEIRRRPEIEKQSDSQLRYPQVVADLRDVHRVDKPTRFHFHNNLSLDDQVGAIRAERFAVEDDLEGDFSFNAQSSASEKDGQPILVNGLEEA
jgi:hypothetical protein